MKSLSSSFSADFQEDAIGDLSSIVRCHGYSSGQPEGADPWAQVIGSVDFWNKSLRACVRRIMRPCWMIFLVWPVFGAWISPSHSLEGQMARARASETISGQMFVQIGGVPQWITIKGEDRSNPVVLFLHGGPGDALSPYGDSMYVGWDKSFTLVQWDQRGAGRTFTKNGPSIEPTMTVERMAQDGIEVTEFLTTHLHQKKIIILGGSWGSVLGVYMAHARPDLSDRKMEQSIPDHQHKQT